MNSVNPSSYVNKRWRNYAHSFNVSSWFREETMTVDFGDYVGRPSKNLLMQREYLTRFLENGWTIDAVVSSSEDGVWETVSDATTESISSSSNSSSQHRVGDSHSIQGSSGSSTAEESRTEENSREEGSGGNQSHSKNTGDAYWEAVLRVRLKRRRMMPELVLQAMIGEFTTSYNDGLRNDDQRFNELVSLYMAFSNANQADASSLVSGATDLTPLFDRIMESVESAAKAAETSAYVLSDSGIDAAIADIRRAFSEKAAEAKAQMVTNGTYNGTVWPSILAGFTREEEAAVAKARSEAGASASAAFTSILNSKGSIYANLIEARNRLETSKDNRKVSAMELRNNVLKWMIDFAGSRDDVYPQLQEISQLAERIGFSVGATGNVL